MKPRQISKDRGTGQGLLQLQVCQQATRSPLQATPVDSANEVSGGKDDSRRTGKRSSLSKKKITSKVVMQHTTTTDKKKVNMQKRPQIQMQMLRDTGARGSTDFNQALPSSFTVQPSPQGMGLLSQQRSFGQLLMGKQSNLSGRELDQSAQKQQSPYRSFQSPKSASGKAISRTTKAKGGGGGGLLSPWSMKKKIQYDGSQNYIQSKQNSFGVQQLTEEQSHIQYPGEQSSPVTLRKTSQSKQNLLEIPGQGKKARQSLRPDQVQSMNTSNQIQNNGVRKSMNDFEPKQLTMFGACGGPTNQSLLGAQSLQVSKAQANNNTVNLIDSSADSLMRRQVTYPHGVNQYKDTSMRHSMLSPNKQHADDISQDINNTSQPEPVRGIKMNQSKPLNAFKKKMPGMNKGPALRTQNSYLHTQEIMTKSPNNKQRIALTTQNSNPFDSRFNALAIGANKSMPFPAGEQNKGQFDPTTGKVRLEELKREETSDFSSDESCPEASTLKEADSPTLLFKQNTISKAQINQIKSNDISVNMTQKKQLMTPKVQRGRKQNRSGFVFQTQDGKTSSVILPADLALKPQQVTGPDQAKKRNKSKNAFDNSPIVSHKSKPSLSNFKLKSPKKSANNQQTQLSKQNSFKNQSILTKQSSKKFDQDQKSGLQLGSNRLSSLDTSKQGSIFKNFMPSTDAVGTNLNSANNTAFEPERHFELNEENRFSFAPMVSAPIQLEDKQESGPENEEEPDQGEVENLEPANKVCANTVTFNLNVQDGPPLHRGMTFAPSPAMSGRVSSLALGRAGQESLKQMSVEPNSETDFAKPNNQNPEANMDILESPESSADSFDDLSQHSHSHSRRGTGRDWSQDHNGSHLDNQALMHIKRQRTPKCQSGKQSSRVSSIELKRPRKTPEILLNSQRIKQEKQFKQRNKSVNRIFQQIQDSYAKASKRGKKYRASAASDRARGHAAADQAEYPDMLNQTQQLGRDRKMSGQYYDQQNLAQQVQGPNQMGASGAHEAMTGALTGPKYKRSSSNKQLFDMVQNNLLPPKPQKNKPADLTRQSSRDFTAEGMAGLGVMRANQRGTLPVSPDRSSNNLRWDQSPLRNDLDAENSVMLANLSVQRQNSFGKGEVKFRAHLQSKQFSNAEQAIKEHDNEQQQQEQTQNDHKLVSSSKKHAGTSAKKIKSGGIFQYKTHDDKSAERSKSIGTMNKPSVFSGALNLTQVNEYKLGKLLGQGAYAVVREAVHVETGFRVALKIYDKYKLNQNQNIKKSVQREIKVLHLLTTAKLGDDGILAIFNQDSKDKDGQIDSKPAQLPGHPSIMKLFDAIDSYRHLYLVLESCEGQMLHTVVQEHADHTMSSYRKCLPEKACAQIIYQIILGLAYCHSKNISHRDIKLENILVNYNSPEKTTKIIDFGFAAQTKDSCEKLRTFCGTPAYMSPELTKKKEYSGPASDNWAAGVLLYTLLFGTQPFKARTEADLFRLICKGQLHFPKSSHPDFTSSGVSSPQADRHRIINLTPKEGQLPSLSKNQSSKSAKRLATDAKDLLSSPDLRQTASPKGPVDHDPLSGAIYYSRPVRSLIQDLLQVDDTKRIQAADVLRKYQGWFESHEVISGQI